ncbi:MAG: YeaH/YhbH family protein [Caulobacteraceae bacterium]|nr:YeaH/YhbH family protein [Caulobacteraceae bacterium]
MMNIIDRRLNPSGKSLPNRQRFIRLAKATIREAVVRSIKDRALGDVGSKEVVDIPVKRIAEPRLRHSAEGGDRDQVLPGNKEFVRGDTLPKPKSGRGEKGSQASPDGEGEDSFRFTISAEEYLDVLFEELELPDLAKAQLKDTSVVRYRRAGHSPTGSPSNLNLLRTMRKSLARRISLRRPKSDDFARLEAEIAELEAMSERTPEEDEKLGALWLEREKKEARSRRIAYIDPVDLRFNRFEATPQPSAQAVMFCLMDVSGSMTEDMKDLAKRFFLLLHLFLTRQYEHVDIVFIRHTSEAKEVDEETFFRSAETGGTVVSTALAEMRRIVDERYPVDDWNIYAAQASDGDNYSSDSQTCIELLTTQILPICQYFAYVEVYDRRQAEIFLSSLNVSELWKDYQSVAVDRPNFAMKRVFSKADVFPVFHQLFAKARNAAA